MSSRVVVVSIKPIIIANAYASLSAKELRVFPAKPSQGRIGSACREGSGTVSRGCHCCCLVPACDRCNRRAAPARPGPVGHGRTNETTSGSLERTHWMQEEGSTTGATPRPSRSCHCSLSAKCRAQLWAGLIAVTRQAREGGGGCRESRRQFAHSDVPLATVNKPQRLRRQQSPFSFSRALKQIFCS